ncbi:MAG: MerR family transcriptional regulator [Actinomycetota bacterium]|nr:MerR family transcriptional regulator [Actinomycetota bacterium]
MPLSRTRDYLSIGEVLETIQADFPDISISKIRFLEAEGLISPERTGSGYRKFYEPDVKRLRYILSLQRDHFLPLKVIRERLIQFEANGGEPPPSDAPAPPSRKKKSSNGSSAPAPADLSDVSLSRDELKKASGLAEEQLAGLEDFGVLGRGQERYDGNDLTVAKAAKGLFEYGVEPRHLRMYRQLADREASFIEQIVSPVTHKKDRDAQREASMAAQTLLQLSRSMRDALLRSGLREFL